MITSAGLDGPGVFLRGDTLLRPERLEFQPERLELLHSSEDVASVEEGRS